MIVFLSLFNIIKNYGIQLNDNDMQELSEYINALEFEAYRNKNADDSHIINPPFFN